MRRFIRALLFVSLLAAAFAGVASALDFNDEAEEAPRGEVGKLYHFEMPSHGGCFYAPYRYVVESGKLAPGLKLGNARNLVGLVDGVPTEPGIFTAWIALKDVCGNSAELLFTFEIWVRRWGIATDSLSPASVGAPYSFQLKDQGITSNVTYEVTDGTLPAGLTLSPGGLISGTPTAVGSASFTVKGTAVSTNPSADGTRIDSKTFTLSVSGAARGAGLHSGRRGRRSLRRLALGDRGPGPVHLDGVGSSGRTVARGQRFDHRHSFRRRLVPGPGDGDRCQRQREDHGRHVSRRAEARDLDEERPCGEGR